MDEAITLLEILKGRYESYARTYYEQYLQYGSEVHVENLRQFGGKVANLNETIDYLKDQQKLSS